MFVENTRAYFSHFGETCQLAGVDVDALFNEPYSQFDGIGGTRPSALVRSDVNPQRRQSFVRKGVAYSVAAIEPDGMGFSLLILEKS